MIPVRARAAAAAAGFAGLLYWMAQGPRHESKTFSEPKLAADFAYPDLSGKTRKLSDFRGKVVLVDFWATWCDPCVEAIPDLSRLHHDLAGKDFALLGVALDARGREIVAPFVEKRHVPYPVVLGEASTLREWPIPGFPTSFLIDRDGRVLKRYLGGVPYAELEGDVKEALAR